jgi:hypothetical protein
MDMKGHILAALREQLDRWEELLEGLTEAQITAPHFDDDWSIQDIVNHLWGWQQISIGRMQGGVLDRGPEFPTWLADYPGEWDDDPDRTNAWIYRHWHSRPWAETYRAWRDGFLRLLELGEALAERDLLDADRCSWLNGYSLAFILVASYDHHQEHLEKLTRWLETQESRT